jgi:hypothetical protein
MKLNIRKKCDFKPGILLILAVFITTFQSNSQCSIKKEKDAFTGKVTLSSDFEVIGKAEKNGLISFKIIETIANDSDTSLQLVIFINRLTSRCLGEESNMLIKSGEQIIQLKLSIPATQCGTHLYSTINLSSANKQWLRDRYINQIRIQYEKDIFDDFTTNIIDKNNELYALKSSDYFIRIFKCLKKMNRNL